MPLNTGFNSVSLDRKGYSEDSQHKDRISFLTLCVDWENFDARALRAEGVKQFHVSKYSSQLSQIEKWISLVFNSFNAL